MVRVRGLGESLCLGRSAKTEVQGCVHVPIFVFRNVPPTHVQAHLHLKHGHMSNLPCILYFLR